MVIYFIFIQFKYVVVIYFIYLFCFYILSESQQKTQIEIISFLVSKGARLDHLDNNGNSFFSWSVYQKNVLLVQYAIQNGFDVNQPIDRTHTPLTLAIERDCFTIVKYMIENGANVNQQDQMGNTPLSLAKKNEQH